MIDTHAHLIQTPLGFAASPFDKGEKTIECDVRNLKWVVLAASNLKDSKANLELAKINPKLRPAVGIHPQEIITNFKLRITNLEKMLIDNKNIVAVGECGLEYTEGLDKKAQETLFRAQIGLSLKYGKPLIVHSREASEETVEILKDYKYLRGVIHCYTGGKKRIKKYLDISDNWYFGFDGNLTYETGLGQVVAMIPKNRLVLETDTPYLSPVPHRGKINRPEWIEYTYRKVAEIWGTSFEDTETLIDRNAENLFQIIRNNVF